MLKNSSTLAVSVPINFSNKFRFVSVNGLTLWTRLVLLFSPAVKISTSR